MSGGRGGGRGRGRGGPAGTKTGDGADDGFEIFQKKERGPRLTAARGRILIEIRDGSFKNHENVLVWLENEKNPLTIHVAVKVTEGMYKGHTIVCQIILRDGSDENAYPLRQPELKLITGQRILHPNINSKGDVCGGFRKQNPWTPKYTCNLVVLQIVNVLVNPNPENAQDGCDEIAAAMAKDPVSFARDVQASLRGQSKFSTTWPSGGDMKRALKSLNILSGSSGTKIISGNPRAVLQDIEGTYGITMIRRFLSATISPRSPKTSTQGKKKKKKKRQSEGVSSPSSSTPKASSFRLRNNSNHSTDAGVSGSTLDEFDINIQIRRAAEKGDAKILASLLDQEGANVKAHTRPGNRTALHCAAFRGHYECVRLILSHGADPNAIDDFDRTALHRAARKGHKQVVRLLIDRGSDVLMVDSNELLPSDLAKKIKFDPTVYDLLVAAEKIARLPRVPPVLPTESSPPVRSLYYRTQLVEAQCGEDSTNYMAQFSD
eukprot:g497.t1